MINPRWASVVLYTICSWGGVFVEGEMSYGRAYTSIAVDEVSVCCNGKGRLPFVAGGGGGVTGNASDLAILYLREARRGSHCCLESSYT